MLVTSASSKSVRSLTFLGEVHIFGFASPTSIPPILVTALGPSSGVLFFRVWVLKLQHWHHWQLVRNANSWSPSKTYWMRILEVGTPQSVFTSHPGDVDACQSLKTTALGTHFSPHSLSMKFRWSGPQSLLPGVDTWPRENISPFLPLRLLNLVACKLEMLGVISVTTWREFTRL